VSGQRGRGLFRYGIAMDIYSDSHISDGASQSSSIDAIRDRIAAIQDKDLNSQVAGYDAIHGELERALTAIDGL
jgi:hypothetical protein